MMYIFKLKRIKYHCQFLLLEVVHLSLCCHFILFMSSQCDCRFSSNTYVVPAHQTSDMSRCTISPESRLKLEMVILSTLRFLAILTFQYVNYKFMCPDFNKH